MVDDSFEIKFVNIGRRNFSLYTFSFCREGRRERKEREKERREKREGR